MKKILAALFASTTILSWAPSALSIEMEPPGTARIQSALLDNDFLASPPMEVSNGVTADWKPTQSPNSQVIPGKMRSDREEIPAGFTKEQADLAETQEARELQLRNMRSNITLTSNNCQTYWPSPFQVCGAIRDHYNKIGGPNSFLTFPRSNELSNPDGAGKRSEFVNGFIYWHPNTGAHSVTTHTSIAWNRNGWEAGWLGYPKSEEIRIDNRGNAVQNYENGDIAVGPLFHSVAIKGKILEKWNQMGRSASYLGMPVTDELPTSDGKGRFTRFQGGAIYWTPSTGAVDMPLLTLTLWGKMGYENSKLGYPTRSPEFQNDGNVLQEFENGRFDAYGFLDENQLASIDGTEVYSTLYQPIMEQMKRTGEPAQSFFESSGQDTPQLLRSQETYAGYKPLNDGGIPIVEGYKFNAFDELSDYCSWSPDFFPGMISTADFRGPCSRHDVCYRENDGSNHEGRRRCDQLLWADLDQVCVVTFSYPGAGVDRNACLGVSEIYYNTVRQVHKGNYVECPGAQWCPDWSRF